MEDYEDLLASLRWGVELPLTAEQRKNASIFQREMDALHNSEETA
jgi:hypothetical protein